VQLSASPVRRRRGRSGRSIRPLGADILQLCRGLPNPMTLLEPTSGTRSRRAKLSGLPQVRSMPNAYFISKCEFAPDNSFAGDGAYALERDKMLAGDPTARMVAPCTKSPGLRMTFACFQAATRNASPGAMPTKPLGDVRGH